MKTVFERKEMKYRLNEEQKEKLLQALSDHLVPDEYPDYRISSVYYDDAGWNLFRKSIEKPSFKEKLRLRQYDSGEQFLEIKKKAMGITYKRRVDLDDINRNPVTAREIERLLEGGLQPKMEVRYHRLAWVWENDPDLRLTIDDQIEWRLYGAQNWSPLFDQSPYILEIKSDHNFPLELVRTLRKLEIWPRSVSKAGLAYQVWKENL